MRGHCNVAMLAISTPTATLARETVNLDAVDKGPTGAPGQTFLPFDLFTPENIYRGMIESNH